MVASSLPLPRLAARTIDSIPIFTDDALYDASSVRIAFTGRAGGASEGDYASLNLGTHVGDDRNVVLGNRRALLCALGEPDMPLVVPNQVHGTDLVDIETSDPEALRDIQNAADRRRGVWRWSTRAGAEPWRVSPLQLASALPLSMRASSGMTPRFLPSSTPISDRISVHRASRRGPMWRNASQARSGQAACPMRAMSIWKRRSSSISNRRAFRASGLRLRTPARSASPTSSSRIVRRAAYAVAMVHSLSVQGKEFMAMGIAERYEKVEEELAQECALAGRDPKEVRLVAVSKTVGVEGVGEAYAAGARDFGENRPDQIVPKSQAFPDAHWHFIGNIQSRRIRDIVDSASLIHSVYQEKHARKIDEVAREKGIVQNILIEVNVSGEESKSGVSPDEAEALVDVCETLPNVRVRGFMTMAPQGDLEIARRCFEGLAKLAEKVRASLPASSSEAFDELSMGMSEDWREAVHAGATIVRIGRAIFSDSF